VNGHILAMERGKSGENYILGGVNITYNQFFEELARVSGIKRKLFKLPRFLMLFIANLLLFLARLTGKNPMITPGLVMKFLSCYNLSSSRAVTELGYKPTDISSALTSTINWLKLNKDS
jgi:nucleoside-diphosphate-sugar epimerase